MMITNSIESPENRVLTMEDVARALQYDVEKLNGTERQQELEKIAVRLRTSEDLEGLASHILSNLPDDLRAKYATPGRLVEELQKIEWNFRIHNNFLGKVLGGAGGRVEEYGIRAPLRGARDAWKKPWVRKTALVAALVGAGVLAWFYGQDLINYIKSFFEKQNKEIAKAAADARTKTDQATVKILETSTLDPDYSAQVQVEGQGGGSVQTGETTSDLLTKKQKAELDKKSFGFGRR